MAVSSHEISINATLMQPQSKVTGCLPLRHVDFSSYYCSLWENKGIRTDLQERNRINGIKFFPSLLPSAFIIFNGEEAKIYLARMIDHHG